MKSSFRLSIALLLATCTVARADILLTNSRVYTQNFNGANDLGPDTSLSAATNGTTSSLMPADWFFSETPTTDGLYATNAGGTTTGNTYSYGVNLDADRALGELTAGAPGISSTFGAKFKNNGNSNMTKIKQLIYTGEQWRVGGTHTTIADKLTIQYSTDATSLTTGSWFGITGMDFNSPVTSSTGGSLNGNLSANRTLKSLAGPPYFAFATPVAPGGNFWIRWVPTDASGADDGLAVEDFSIQAIPEPSTMALCGLIFGALGIGLVRRRRRIAS